MKRVVGAGAVVALLLVLVGVSALSAADKPVTGTIARVDMDLRMLVVKNSQGQESTVYWNDSTRVDGGSLQEGATVTIQTKDDAGRILATSIQVTPKAGAKPKESGQ